MVNDYKVTEKNDPLNKVRTIRAVDAAHAAEQVAENMDEDGGYCIIQGEPIELRVEDERGTVVYFIVRGEANPLYYAEMKINE